MNKCDLSTQSRLLTQHIWGPFAVFRACGSGYKASGEKGACECTLYHGFGWFESRERGYGTIVMVEGISQVRIMDTSHPHNNIPHLATVAM